MIVVVSKKGVKVKAHGKYHSLGETINELSEAEAKRLVDGGTCKYVPSSFVPRDSDSDVQIPDEAEKTEQPKAPEVGAKIKLSTDKKTKVGAKTPEESNEVGPDTSHPLV